MKAILKILFVPIVLCACTGNSVNDSINQEDDISTDRYPTKGKEIIAGIHLDGSCQELEEQNKYFQKTVLNWNGIEYAFEVTPICENNIIIGASMGNCGGVLVKGYELNIETIGQIYFQKYSALQGSSDIVQLKSKYILAMTELNKIDPSQLQEDIISQRFLYLLNTDDDLLIEIIEHNSSNLKFPCININYLPRSRWIEQMQDYISTTKWAINNKARQNKNRTVESIGDF